MAEAQIFRASDILDMAVRIEHQGLAFYQACASETEGGKTEDLFRFLIEQERKHAEVFAGMKEELEDYELPESYPGETRSYLDAFVRDRVFSSPEEAEQKAREISDISEAVDMALELEKASILFYSGIKDVVRESEHEAIDRIIKEEHNHIRRLLAQRNDSAR